MKKLNFPINPRTQLMVDSVINASKHAILVYGPQETGIDEIASYIVQSIMRLENVKKATNPKIYEIKHTDGSAIKLDELKKAASFIHQKAKTNGKKPERALIIHGADQLTREAQNKILKDLEEPPSGLVICLTANNKEKLLPTIRSRVQVVEALPLTKSQFIKLMKDLGITDSAEIDRRYYITEGMVDLARENDLEEKLSIEQIKAIFRDGLYQSLIDLGSIKDRNELASFLGLMARLAKGAISNSLSSGNTKTIAYWIQVSKAIEQAQDAIARNGLVKLHISRLLTVIYRV